MASFVSQSKVETKKFRSPSTSSRSYVSISNGLDSKRSKVLAEERQKADKIRRLKKDNCALESAIKILASYSREQEIECLIDKWRSICQAGMSYLLNSTLLKINKMGGYEELVRKEVEAEKRKLEYQLSGQLEYEIDDVIESEDFKKMSVLDQEELKRQLYERKEEADKAQQAQMEKLDARVEESSGKEFTMQNLARRLKVNYEMIFES
ncbi:LAFA_0E18118g1_1 [Lachancea sp. 'fantastica']|nr:LAFA_0E18118g1_1 [Lachancea sp. 'fantastica']